jgi:hypothetical protein
MGNGELRMKKTADFTDYRDFKPGLNHRRVSQTRGVKCLGGTWVKSARAPMAVTNLILTPSAVNGYTKIA